MEKMNLKFAANVSMMFREYPTIPERIMKAKFAGFKGVEITMPYVEEKDTIAKSLKEHNVSCELINCCLGSGNEFLATKPDRVNDFKEKLEVSIDYAKALGCSRMHLLAGTTDPKFTVEEVRSVYIKNMCYAADRLAKENITGFIECVNSVYTVPGYFVDTPEKALQLIKEIDRPNIQFQLDVFHLQIVKGDLTNNIKKLLPHTGYIQVSQVPDRSEPDSSGEINYTYIFDLLQKLGYDGWIGTEYNPAGNTMKGLAWFEKYK